MPNDLHVSWLRYYKFNWIYIFDFKSIANLQGFSTSYISFIDLDVNRSSRIPRLPAKRSTGMPRWRKLGPTNLLIYTLEVKTIKSLVPIFRLNFLSKQSLVKTYFLNLCINGLWISRVYIYLYVCHKPAKKLDAITLKSYGWMGPFAMISSIHSIII